MPGCTSPAWGSMRRTSTGTGWGEDLLTPGFTEYTSYVRYQTYDVTALLREDNELQVTLGDGWYKGRFGLKGRTDIYGNRYLLAAELRQNGRTLWQTDRQFEVWSSGFLSSGIYDGECFDANIVPERLCGVELTQAGYPIVPQSGPPVRVMGERKPILIRTPKGEQVLDFGQNMAGLVRFTCRTPKGARVTLQAGEILQQGCFYRDNLRDAKARFDYISDGQMRQVCQHFTYYGFRYMLVEGIEQVDPALQRRDFELLPAGGLETRTRAMLKVQDGCNNFCSYCIIPYARGPVRSAPLETAVAQGLTLAKAGYREIVVTGIEIASWGWDLKDRGNLTDLVESLCSALPEVRIRLGSLEPRVVTEEFCRRLSRFSNLCPQFHLSLQSGSDAVLTRMRRKYHTERYMQSVTLLRTFFPGCALTTDLIVGFPGETEAELSESLSFARQCRFAAMHVFRYSPRAGTRAAAFPEQCSGAEKTARMEQAQKAAKTAKENFLKSQIGTEFPVLFERERGDGYHVGHTPNGTVVRISAKNPKKSLRNRIFCVRIEESDAECCYGTLTESGLDEDL